MWEFGVTKTSAVSFTKTKGKSVHREWSRKPIGRRRWLRVSAHRFEQSTYRTLL